MTTLLDGSLGVLYDSLPGQWSVMTVYPLDGCTVSLAYLELATLCLCNQLKACDRHSTGILGAVTQQREPAWEHEVWVWN